MNYINEPADYFCHILITTFLLISSYKDIKTHLLSTRFSFIFFFLIMTAGILSGNITLLSSITGLFPGTLLLLFAKITGESIGYGDGIVMLILGFSLGFSDTLLICIISFVLCSVVGIFISIFNHNISRKSNIPFIPFIFSGYIINLIAL